MRQKQIKIQMKNDQNLENNIEPVKANQEKWNVVFDFDNTLVHGDDPLKKPFYPADTRVVFKHLNANNQCDLLIFSKSFKDEIKKTLNQLEPKNENKLKITINGGNEKQGVFNILNEDNKKTVQKGIDIRVAWIKQQMEQDAQLKSILVDDTIVNIKDVIDNGGIGIYVPMLYCDKNQEQDRALIEKPASSAYLSLTKLIVENYITENELQVANEKIQSLFRNLYDPANEEERVVIFSEAHNQRSTEIDSEYQKLVLIGNLRKFIGLAKEISERLEIAELKDSSHQSVDELINYQKQSLGRLLTYLENFISNNPNQAFEESIGIIKKEVQSELSQCSLDKTNDLLEKVIDNTLTHEELQYLYDAIKNVGNIQLIEIEAEQQTQSFNNYNSLVNKFNTLIDDLKKSNSDKSKGKTTVGKDIAKVKAEALAVLQAKVDDILRSTPIEERLANPEKTLEEAIEVALVSEFETNNGKFVIRNLLYEKRNPISLFSKGVSTTMHEIDKFIGELEDKQQVPEFRV